MNSYTEPSQAEELDALNEALAAMTDLWAAATQEAARLSDERDDQGHQVQKLLHLIGMANARGQAPMAVAADAAEAWAAKGLR